MRTQDNTKHATPEEVLRPRSTWKGGAPSSADLRAAGVCGAALVAMVAFVILFQWNWLRGPLAHMIGGRLNRPVSITGNLEVHPWSWSPSASIEGLTIGNPSWSGPGPMVTIPRVTVKAKLLPLLQGQFVLPLVRADHPDLRLITDSSGRSNWTLGDGRPAGPAQLHIARLIVVGGKVRYDDIRRRIGFIGTLSSDEGLGQPGGGLSLLDGNLTVGAANWANPAPTLQVPRLLVAVKVLPFMSNGQLVLPLVQADRAVIHLVRDAAGRESWNVTGEKQPAFKAPPINRLIISNAAFTLDDATRRLHAAGVVSSSEDVNNAGRGRFRLQGNGILNDTRFKAEIVGGPLIHIDRNRPYRFDAKLESGAMRVRLAGQVARPFDFGVVSGKLFVSGEDLSDLYHLTGLALPRSPPYQVAAGFSRRDAVYALGAIRGRFGRSDLAGEMSVNDTTGRPFVKANLVSERLRLVDLAAVVGGVPRRTAGQPLSPTQKRVAAKLKAEHRVLPDVHLDVSRARVMDARVIYRADSVEAGKLAVHALVLNLSLDHGVISANPLELILPQGRLAGSIRIDGRGAVPNTAVDMRLTNARLEHLIGHAAANPPLAGGLFAHIKIVGVGDSVRDAAANLSGETAVAIPGGQIRRTFVEFLGIDVIKGLYLLLTKNQSDAPIRCGFADFRAQGGVLTATQMVVDTGPVLINGKGQIDLRHETLDFSVQGHPKGFRLVRLAAPITVKGSLLTPKIGVDIVKAAPQALLSVAVGALAAPAAALLPFLHGGGPKDVDCAALMAQANSRGVAVRGLASQLSERR